VNVTEQLADDLAAVLTAEPLGLPCAELTARVKRRRGDVLTALRADPRFEHHGRNRGSRWRLAAGVDRGRNGAGFRADGQPELGSDPSSQPARRERAGERSRPSAAELLENPHALLTRSHMRELGHGRRAIDAIFRQLPLILDPEYARPRIKAADYLAHIERHTYGNDVVHPSRRGTVV
jgi:hypothetical protein